MRKFCSYLDFLNLVCTKQVFIISIEGYETTSADIEYFIFETGCVEVVGCVTREELISWKEVPEAVNTFYILHTPPHVLLGCTFAISVFILININTYSTGQARRAN